MAVHAVSSFLGRRLALGPILDDLIETERVLATARAVLAIGFLVAVYLDPSEPSRGANLANILLLLYCGYSVLLFAILLFEIEVTPRFTVAVHGADVLWPAVISLFTDGPNSPFFLFFIFAILAAALRWDVREAIFTALLAATTVVAEGIALSAGTYLGGARLDLDGFIMRGVYLMMFGCLIGYLAKSEKRRRAEALSFSRLSAKASVEAGLKGTLLAVLQELLGLFGSRELRLVISDAEADQAHLWRIDALGSFRDAQRQNAIAVKRAVRVRDDGRYAPEVLAQHHLLCGEHPRGQRLAVQGSVGPDRIGKARRDLAERGPARLDHLARHLIGIHHRDAAGGHHAPDGALAGPDVAG